MKIYLCVLFVVLLGFSETTDTLRERSYDLSVSTPCLICRVVVYVIEELLKYDNTELVKYVAEEVCILSPAETKPRCKEIMDGIVDALEKLVKEGHELAPICYSAMWCSAYSDPFLKEWVMGFTQDLRTLCDDCRTWAAILKKAAQQPLTDEQTQRAAADLLCHVFPDKESEKYCQENIGDIFKGTIKKVNSLSINKICEDFGLCSSKNSLNN